MAEEIKRYRVRPKSYLCLTPNEALSTGITMGEQIIEELTLVKSPGFGYQEYAAVRKENEEALKKISVLEREEKFFEARSEAVEFVKNKGTERYWLCGVKETKTVQRAEIGEIEEQPIEDFMEELKSFEKKD